MNSTAAARILNISRRRVLQLAAAGRLPGVKEGRDWHFERADVEAFALIQRPAGYPAGKPRSETE